jgi:diguanylate cyclase (GGDEF)-like protein
LAVLRIEIGGLTAANESLGRRGGDELLRAAAQRLTSCIREGDTVARLAAAEFGLLLPGVRYQDDVTTIANKVFARLREPVEIDSETVTLGANAGISLFPEDGDGTEALLANAADAMGRARRLGSGHYLLYAATAERDPLEALGTGNHALSNALLGTHHEGTPGVLHYQPVYDLETQRIEGVETFLRWQHPELGLVFPRHFLLGADFTGLILAIGPWILRTACAQVRTWQRRDHRTLRLAVNLSSHELRDPNLAQNVGTALTEANLAPRFLQLEIPEDWAMSDVGRARDVIGGLRALGVSVCLDGFGDDPSSMLQLRYLPVDAVKLNLFGERSVSPAGGEEATKVASAISMAKSFHLRVIAQGVESRELIDQLRTWQCDEVQGYHWGAPMSPARCERLLRGLSGRLLTAERAALENPGPGETAPDPTPRRDPRD